MFKVYIKESLNESIRVWWLNRDIILGYSAFEYNKNGTINNASQR